MTLHNLKPDTIMDDELLAPQDFLDLQVLWYLYQFSPDYVLGAYNSSHRDEGLIALFMQDGDYSLTDLTYVLDAQHSHMGNVLPMYSELAANGQVELTTTPHYHPIMPLLMMDGWTMEDGIRVNKEAWPVDVQNHLVTGMDLFETELGFRPVGMWPSEQAVSPAMVEPVTDVGIQWMVSDEEILKQSTDVNGQLIDVEDASNLATPWTVTGVEGSETAVIFRDRVISDRIAFQYGTMTPEAAVSDFISYLETCANNFSMRVKTRLNIFSPLPSTVKIGCSCLNSSTTTTLAHSWPSGTDALPITLPSSPLPPQSS